MMHRKEFVSTCSKNVRQCNHYPANDFCNRTELLSEAEGIGSVRHHKFKVGSRVGLISSPARTAEGEYKIVRLLPADGEDFQYRIKNVGEPNERLAKEFQLYAWQT